MAAIRCLGSVSLLLWRTLRGLQPATRDRPATGSGRKVVVPGQPLGVEGHAAGAADAWEDNQGPVDLQPPRNTHGALGRPSRRGGRLDGLSCGQGRSSSTLTAASFDPGEQIDRVGQVGQPSLKNTLPPRDPSGQPSPYPTAAAPYPKISRPRSPLRPISATVDMHTAKPPAEVIGRTPPRTVSERPCSRANCHHNDYSLDESTWWSGSTTRPRAR